MSYVHKSVLVKEVIEYLALKKNGLYVDATFGGGGHTRAILSAEPSCKVIAVDWDLKALDINFPILDQEFPGRVIPCSGNFSQLSYLLKKNNIFKVDGILADFGTSQYQIKQKEGFSFSIDTPLDMRMSAGHFKTTAADIVNTASAEELATIFFRYGEEHNSRNIAKKIVQYRKEVGKIKTTKQLADIITSIIPVFKRKTHPATKVFQALRIVVNDELNNINSLLIQSENLLNPAGRLVCISFHSLEDRAVKQFIKEKSSVFKNLTSKVITASDEELRANSSSRSAKLRAAEKI